jgi:glycosyltransferase involved in cell wall biosynthesis
MKIALVHNTYQWPGGEDVIVEQERDLLRSAGHQVLEYRRSNHEIGNGAMVRQIALAQRAVWSSGTFNEFRALLRQEKPDVVHVHNTFVMISPSIYWACAEENVPVVQTLHNFRLFCPPSNFLRDGKICEECVEHSLLRGVAYGCYHGSRIATGAAALVLAAHRWVGTWTHKIDCYIAVSQFARRKFEHAGLPSRKLVVKPHFVYPDPGPRSGPGDYAIFVGRFTSEKGLPTLLNAWSGINTSVPLMIVGDGPLRESLEAQAAEMNNSRVVFRGHLSRDATLAAVKGAKILLCASECYEQGPATVLEAFACGVPVIAPSLGPIDEVVDDGRTGLLFRAGDPAHLAKKIEWALSHDEQLQSMGKSARAKFEANFSANKNYTRLMEIYERVISGRGYAINQRGSLDEACYAPGGIASVERLVDNQPARSNSAL